MTTWARRGRSSRCCCSTLSRPSRRNFAVRLAHGGSHHFSVCSLHLCLPRSESRSASTDGAPAKRTQAVPRASHEPVSRLDDAGWLPRFASLPISRQGAGDMLSVTRETLRRQSGSTRVSATGVRTPRGHRQLGVRSMIGASRDTVRIPDGDRDGERGGTTRTLRVGRPGGEGPSSPSNSIQGFQCRGRAIAGAFCTSESSSSAATMNLAKSTRRTSWR